MNDTHTAFQEARKFVVPVFYSLGNIFSLKNMMIPVMKVSLISKFHLGTCFQDPDKLLFVYKIL